MEKIYKTTSEEDTIKIARDFSASLKNRDFICLHGDLGMGKSVFARAVIRTLTGDEGLNVPSPTFNLVQTYDCDSFPISHFDFYRLEDEEELFEIGWDDALENGIVLAEWVSKIPSYIPSKRIDVFIEQQQTGRKIKIQGMS